MGSVWYCCSCKFGPFDPSLYLACINCNKPRCGACDVEPTKVADSHSSHTHSHSCHETSPYPAAITMHSSARRPSFGSQPMSIGSTDLPGVSPIGRLGLGLAGPLSSFGGYQPTRTVGATYMYICCSCGDGPKVYNTQPACINCEHVACSSCDYVK